MYSICLFRTPRYNWGFFMTSDDDIKYMSLALKLAEKGRGKTSPNPLVGAVIVKNGRIVGQGYHRKAGTAHAEIVALNATRDKAVNATLYVNLEPCCHYGRTRPCTGEIIKAGIKRVVLSMKDPNPLVAGKGVRQLKRAGITVKSGLLKREAERQNEVYLKYIRTGRPFVILKTAQTLDGRIATSSGDSRWITGTKARKLVHQLRAEYDGVAVGGGTVRTDNPRLTVRSVRGENPYRIIVSTHPKFSRSMNIFRNNTDVRTILATSKRAAGDFKMKNLTIWTIKENKDGISLDDLLDKAGQFGLTSLLVEGGRELATSFIRAGLVDKQYLFIAPKIIGKGINAIGRLNIRKMSEALIYKDFYYNCESCAPDMLFVGYPKR